MLCKKPLATDPQNCGTVGFDVTKMPNVASATCVGGHPVIASCDAGWFDTNLDASDGCEAVKADQFEPNDTQDTAVTIEARVFGPTIHSATDVDWFRFFIGCTSLAIHVGDSQTPIDHWEVSCSGEAVLLDAAPGIVFAGPNPGQTVQNVHAVFQVPTNPPDVAPVTVEVLGTNGAIGPYSLAVGF